MIAATLSLTTDEESSLDFVEQDFCKLFINENEMESKVVSTSREMQSGLWVLDIILYDKDNPNDHSNPR